MTKNKCAYPPCIKTTRTLGWCQEHYDKNRRYGTPLGSGKRFSTPQEALEARTRWEDGCLLWTGSSHHLGYGRLRTKGKNVYAHRLAWEIANGPIPEGAEIDHICHSPACVNLEHLRIATRGENASYLKGSKRHSTSGVRNVYKSREKWCVQIQHDGVIHHFGTFETVQEAAAVAESERKKLHGEFFHAG